MSSPTLGTSSSFSRQGRAGGDIVMTTRRDMLRALPALLAAPHVAATADGRGIASTGRRLDILVLGGTGFLGPHEVREALARGHRVTLFNRGRRAPGLYGRDVEVLLGNRDTRLAPGLASLRGTRRWDVVIDNSGYVPRHVRDSVDLLRQRCERYLFVSTVSVYDFDSVVGRIDESAPLQATPSAAVETVSGATYGALKAECDRIVRARLDRRATVVRPAFIVGPGDDTDRFTYWVDRVARGGEVLAPADPDATLQWIDVRDLCAWMLDLAERDVPGVFNAAGPSTSWLRLLQELAKLSTRPVDVRWSTPAVLREAGIVLPLVGATGRDVLPTFDGTHAATSGLRYRPLLDTAQAVLEWWRAQPPERRAHPDGWPTEAQEREALQLLARS
jgi:2'-hydroxyisoflavone reductase